MGAAIKSTGIYAALTAYHPPLHIVAVSAIVRDEGGKVLLVLHPIRGWEMPGGQVEVGESLPTALTREVQEETGLAISVGSLVGIYSNIKPPTKVIFGFQATCISGDLTTSSESLKVEWVESTHVLERISHQAIHDRMQDMLNFSGRVMYRVYTLDPYQIVEERFLE